MPRHLFAGAVLLLALLAAPFAAGPARAQTTAYATADVNLRAGPSTAYPVITVIPAGAGLVSYGCVPDYSWCDVSLGAYRGWVAASYMQVVYQGAPVVVTPGVAAAVGIGVAAFSKVYWDTHYAAYPWYGRWAAYPVYGPRPVPRYAAPPPGPYRAPYAAPYPAPRVTSRTVTGSCAGGTCTGTRSATGVYGGSTSQTRTCTTGNCTATRSTTGPYGGTATRSRSTQW